MFQLSKVESFVAACYTSLMQKMLRGKNKRGTFQRML